MEATKPHDFSLLGRGIYSVPEAARIASLAVGTRIHPQTIHRWLWGYRYKRAGQTLQGNRLWRPELPILGGLKLLSFRDLVEVQFVATFRNKGVSLHTIRRIIGRATELLQAPHPLSSLSFKTDGTSVVADMVDEKERRLVYDLDSSQFLLELVFDRLRAGLDYADLQAARWWPLGKDHAVVVDPHRSFGRSIVVDEGVPTAVLKGAFKAERSIEKVSYWYEVSQTAVRDALEYEERLETAA